MTRPVHHLATPEEWDAARARGVLDSSTRGLSLAEVGFVHAAYAGQVAGVRSRFYGDVAGPLVLLTIDPDRLGDVEVVEEVGDPATGELFPHVYGPVPVAAVVATEVLDPPH